MTEPLANRNINLIPGGDLYCRSFDPLGAYMRSQFIQSTALPVITLATAADQTPAVGTTYTAVFTSTELCSWRLLYTPSDDAVLTMSADTLTATVTWVIPPGARKTSEYVGVEASNNSYSVIFVDRVHVGATSVRWIGSGKPYATLAAAITGAPAGTRFVVANGTYTSSNMFVNSTTGKLPDGVYTTYTDGDGNTRYTVTSMTTYMAEYPHDVVLDGGGSIKPIQITGNHPYEKECLDYDIAAGSTQFQTAPAGSFPRVGIAIKGFRFKGSPDECIQILNSRFIHVQHVSGEMNNADTFGALASRSADILVEYMFFTGKMRGAFIAFKSLRVVERRSGATRQNANGSEPQETHTIYECRKVEQWNCFDIDSKDAWQFQTGTSTIIASFVYAETDFHNDGYYPDFSFNINAGRLIGVNNYCALLSAEAWEHDPTGGAYTFTDLIAHDLTLYESGYNVINGGPLLATNVTISRINNQTGDDWFFACFRPPQRVFNGLFKSIGWDGSSAVDQGYVWRGRNDLLPADSVTNFVLADTVGGLNNPSYTMSFAGQITNSAAAADGFAYLTRLTVGSTLYNANIGVKDIYKIYGKHGTFWGDSGYTQQIDKDWTDNFPHEKLASIFRSYSYTGTTKTLGTQTLSGNRGWMRPGTTLREYLDTQVINGIAAPVHFPYEFSVIKINSDIYILFKTYRTEILEHRVYVDDKMALKVSRLFHCAILKPLRTGKTYEIKLTCVNSAGVESGYSRAVSITL